LCAGVIPRSLRASGLGCAPCSSRSSMIFKCPSYDA
jgi:hypothetical protein